VVRGEPVHTRMLQDRGMNSDSGLAAYLNALAVRVIRHALIVILKCGP